MSYARFATESEAQDYADAVHNALAVNPAYIAERWSPVMAGSDGYFYVYTNSLVSADETVSEIPNFNQNAE